MKKGTLIAVRFLDHCQGTRRVADEGWDKPAACEAVGYLVENTRTHMILSAWISASIDSEESDYILIVKHPGIKIKKLKGPKF